MERPSQKLIAKTLGISTAAVSLALRDTGTISKELSEKVKETARALGYRPNPMLSSLASKRFRESDTPLSIPLALLDFMDKDSSYRIELKARAEQLGYTLSAIDAKSLEKYANPSLTLYNRGVQGIILMGPIPLGSFREDFNWDDFSVVQCGRFLEPLPFDTVRPNIFQAMKLIFTKVMERGYRRIGFALGRHDPLLEDDESRISAALGLLAVHCDPKDHIQPYFGSFTDKQALVNWAKTNKPDCIIGFHIGQCATLVEAGIKVPEEVAFACLHLNGAPGLGDSRNLSIAGMEQQLREIADQSVNLIDQSIRHHARGRPELPRQVLVPSYWVDGDSLPNKR
ncbi:LacI family DNA-binding transcriptional regulator [Pelagicoccus sp. SDUM812005]|uniref:LacI family DNA-binding transcriptional regulator n=1 Tax=Pelagicoccus sp. SDUM812005 TaxID=3041257 RepID=UPI00280D0057|nr:LacI family DNA-binding transcriptional regulator [Pelagicoccus sp. SDUM812005]MDQ8181406.1 LacI family DNA-binding transcriptional regulator [Pelagicoccus sp. SDUM812005]